MTFTLADPDVDLADAQRRFWRAFGKRFGDQVLYFAWMEFQRSGRVHYHALVVDGPGGRDGLTGRWATRTWGLGNVDLSWRPAHRISGRNPVAYAMGYAKKLNGAKGYQQDYSLAPVGLRTFMHPRLRTPAARLWRVSSAVAEIVDELVDAGWSLLAVARQRGFPGVDVAMRSARGRARTVRLRPRWSVDFDVGEACFFGVEMLPVEHLELADASCGE